jgi:hypothetical protein
MEKKEEKSVPDASGISNIAEIKKQMDKSIVELPGFIPGEPLKVKLKRVSLLEMANADIIPNELLTSVNELYIKGVQGLSSIKSTAKTFAFIAQQSLVEPTYDEIKATGLTLTDGQLLSIYLYAVAGVRALKNFR